MDVLLVPSSLNGSGGDRNQYLSSYLINDVLVVDAGCIGWYQTPREQERIQHVLISHSHIDHLAALPIFLENAFTNRPECVTVHGNEAVLECLVRDIFNERVWPDFIGLSRAVVVPSP